MPARGPVPAPSPTPPRPAAPPPVAKATAAMPVMPTPPAVPADPVSVTLNPTESRVLVGATPALVVATVRNMGSLPETFAITVEDLDAGWCTISAPLLALARPWNRMWRGFPLGFRRAVAGRLATPVWAPLRRAIAIAGGALASWLAFNLAFCLWHLPSLYDAALRSPPLHALEHLVFFATALLFWTRVVPAPPWRSPLGELGKVVYLGSTMVVGWVLAIVLAIAGSPLYSVYAQEASRPGHISAFTDQQLAAGVMWVPGSLAYTIAIVVIAYRWLETGGSRPRAGASPKPLSTGVG